jgi:hypothetical protein
LGYGNDWLQYALLRNPMDTGRWRMLAKERLVFKIAHYGTRDQRWGSAGLQYDKKSP